MHVNACRLGNLCAHGGGRNGASTTADFSCQVWTHNPIIIKSTLSLLSTQPSSFIDRCESTKPNIRWAVENCRVDDDGRYVAQAIRMGQARLLLPSLGAQRQTALALGAVSPYLGRRESSLKRLWCTAAQKKK